MSKITLSLLLLISTTCYTFAGSFQGTVRNSATLLPIADVDVFLYVFIPDSNVYQTVTDSNGKYKLTGIMPRKEIYVLFLHKLGYKECYTRVDRLGSQDLECDIFLVPDTIDPPSGDGDSSFIDGSILEPVSGGGQIPVENATISIYSAGGNTVTASNSEGKYKVKVPIGSYAVTVTASGFDPLSTSDLVVDEIGLTFNTILYRIALAVGDNDALLPISFALLQAYPNPFNPVTRIDYQLPVECRVKLTVSNLLGQNVFTLVDGVESAGLKTVTWNAIDNNSSIYFYRLEAVAVHDPSVSFVQVQRAVYIK